MPKPAVIALCVVIGVAVVTAIAVGIAVGYRNNKADDGLDAGKGPSGNADELENYGNYEGKQRFKIDGVIPVTLHKSSKTGLTIVHAEIKQPLMEGYICLATEAHDNDGLPHTLEHLVFMGSKKYPYKGALDMIANRCLAQGTNAWTGIDQTCYTMDTAGSEGFLNLLPIFLDHVLNPTLNDSFFVTEVYHVNGEGQDGGVVFSEMKGRQESPDDLITKEAASLLFPGKCGYKWETGGTYQNLRTTTNNDKILKYHSKFYRPENMIVFVAGSVEKQKLFDSIQTLEEEEETKERKPFVKPFSEPCPPLREAVEKEVEYPDKEETFGKVNIMWRLPEEIRNDRYKEKAHDMIAQYLSGGVSSPIQKLFVEATPPLATYASLGSSFYFMHFSSDNVPIDRLEEIKPAYFSLMRNVSTSEFDMERMRGILQTSLTEREVQMERGPSGLIIFDALLSFIYEVDMENLHTLKRGKERIEDLLKEDESFWRETMKPFLNEEETVVIVGRPSEKRLKEMAKKEETFIENRKVRLGKEGLAEKAKLLKEAKESNDALQIPDEVLATIPIPSAKSIVLPEVIAARSRRLHPDAAAQLPDNADVITDLIDVLDSPYAIQISQYKSPFVLIEANIHTSELDDDLKPYLALYSLFTFRTAVKRGEETVSHQDIDLELSRETSSFYCSISSRTGILSIGVKVEEKKFLKGLQYVKEGITQQVFTQERLQHHLVSFNNSLPQIMKSSGVIMDALLQPMLVKNDSLAILLSLLSQRKLLTTIADDVGENEARETIEKLKKITDFLANPKRMMLHVSGDVKSIAATLEISRREDLEAVLDKYFGAFRQSGDPPSTSVCLAYPPFSEIRLPAKSGTSRVKVVGMGSEKTANLDMYSVMVLGKDHPDLPTLRVIESYFNMMEGPLWKQIRGLGLAYGFSFGYSPLRGYTYFSASRATDVVQAYKEMKKFVDALSEVNGEEVDALTLDSAKSTLIFSLIAASEKPSYIAEGMMSNCFNDRPLNYTKDMIDKTSRVTKADVKRVLRQRVQPLFDPQGNARVVVAANPSKVDQIVRDFREIGLAVEEIDVEQLNDEMR